MIENATLDPASIQQRIVNRNVNPLLRSLPDWVQEYRSHQIAAIEEIVAAFDSGINVVVLDAPTGSGKTLIGETVRRMLNVPALYVCSSKSLQDQFLHDYDYAKVLKGRSNYPTEKYPERFFRGEWNPKHVSCDDCTWSKDRPVCDWCTTKKACPYERAKNAALDADVAVLNTNYWLTEVNGPGRFSGASFVVFDEADTLESNLMGHVSVELSEKRMESYGLFPPKTMTNPEHWKEWIDETIPVLRSYLGRFSDPSPRTQREAKYLIGSMEKLRQIRRGLDDAESPWVYTGKGQEGRGRKDKNVGRAVSFKPSRVDSLGREYVWSHGERFLLMSATVISSDELLDSLGYEGPRETVKVRNTFPVENRRVRYRPVANMTAKMGEEEKQKVVAACREIAAEHVNDRILIHTVSYVLAEKIVAGLLRTGRPVYSYTGAAGRDDALAGYLGTDAAVLVAPSMDRGIDLPGSACRVQVIAKCPFPYLGDRQISARVHSKGGQTWYTVQTIRTIVQMCGRAVRSESDYAVTYVLDRQFEAGVWSRGGRQLFPSWFKDAIEWRRRG